MEGQSPRLGNEGTAINNATAKRSNQWVGRKHRAALARAFLRQAPLLITHRFTTAMLADVIRVMDSGRVAASRSHAELISRGGRYAQWWAAQRLR